MQFLDAKQRGVKKYFFAQINNTKSTRGHIVTTPTTTQDILNTVVGWDMKMTVHTPPPPTTQTQHELHEPQYNIH